MAKKKKGQLQLNFKDERIPKLIGVLLLFFALYLFIAFFSYLFTWKIDQDKVFDLNWRILRTDLEMANWLGRFGAIISDKFFYWGFGLASFGFVYLMVRAGMQMVHRQPAVKMRNILAKTLLQILLVSIFLDFIFGSSSFPWGGAFGEGVSGWMENFVGTIGMIFLFLLIIVMLLVWRLNPNFSELTFAQVTEELKDYVLNLLKRKPARAPSRPGTAANDLPTLRPGVNTPPTPKLESLPEPSRLTSRGEQLAFELDENGEGRRNAPPVRSADAELEIQELEELLTPELEKNPAPSPGAAAIAAQMENPDHSDQPYDPTLELSTYEYPVLPLLRDYSEQKVEIDRAELEANKDQIIETLLNYKIEITKIRATIGPTVTLYEIVPAAGVRISRIKNLEDDIALSLAALGIRIIAPIPGKGTIGIEVPNKKKQMVSMREILAHDKFRRAKMDLPIGLGKTISNEVFVVDLAKMPHLLVAGATGQGKSVGINAILVSLLYKKHPSQVKLVLIDPKKVELFPYSRLEHHFLAFLPGQDEPITTETNRVIHTLNSLCIEMDTRYDLMKKGGARNIKEYNEKFVKRQLNPHKGHRYMPFIVLVIDEFADLIMTAGKEVELPIGRLAQLARAVGIHLIIATQRPSVNIITGVIKANFPARIAFKVTAKVDSRTILDSGGADQLIGQGDMLLSVGGEMVRLQGAFVDTPEVEQVIDFIANQRGYPEPFFLPEYHGDDEDIPGAGSLTYADLDEEFESAARLIVQNQHGSTSMIQRRLKLGYNRAGRIMDQLEAMGVVGPSEGSKAREVLIYDEMELERFLKDLRDRK